MGNEDEYGTAYAMEANIEGRLETRAEVIAERRKHNVVDNIFLTREMLLLVEDSDYNNVLCFVVVAEDKQQRTLRTHTTHRSDA